MEFVRLGGYGVGFVCRMKVGGCEGTVTVAYGGRVCGTITVSNPKQNYVGLVVGDDYLEPGQTAIYYHDLGPGAKYTGTLPLSSQFDGADGNGAVVTMPADAETGPGGKVSFSGPCNSTASKDVLVYGECNESVPYEGFGNPVGLRIRNSMGNCGFVTSTVSSSSLIDSGCPNGNVECWNGGIGTGGVALCIHYTPNINEAGWCRRDVLICIPE